MTWYGVSSVQPTSSKGVQSGLRRNCVFLCMNEVLPVNVWSSGLNTPCFSLAKREMVCMLVKFPRVVTMQGNSVPKAVWISQEKSPLGEWFFLAKEPLPMEHRRGSARSPGSFLGSGVSPCLDFWILWPSPLFAMHFLGCSGYQVKIPRSLSQSMLDLSV